MDKEDTGHIYNGVLLSHKREQNWVIFRDVDELESVIQSEVSQKEKNKYCILTHTCRIYKNGTDELICKAKMETQTYRMDRQTQRKKVRVG